MMLNAIFISLQKGQLQMELNLIFCDKMKYLLSYHTEKGKVAKRLRLKRKIHPLYIFAQGSFNISV